VELVGVLLGVVDGVGGAEPDGVLLAGEIITSLPSMVD
jgi:hypothetical protein